MDCEYLKRCCERLTEENKRLQKELQELRALKSSQPFYMQLPATTLTMCPSCERVVSATTATTVTSTAAVAASTNGKDNSVALQLGNNPARLNPFSQAQQSATWNQCWKFLKYIYICKAKKVYRLCLQSFSICKFFRLKIFYIF